MKTKKKRICDIKRKMHWIILKYKFEICENVFDVQT